MTDDLKGTPVLVHPELGFDPVKRQGQIGLITWADLLNDDVFVSFGDVTGLYSSDALLVLLPAGEVHQNLNPMASEMPFTDLKALALVELLLRYYGENKAVKAMELVRDHQNIRPYCLDTLQNQIAQNITNNYGRE